MKFNTEEIKRLKNGEYIDIHKKRYGYCAACGQIVQVNKRLFGGLHVCGERR